MTLRRIAYVVNVFPKLSETFIAGELAELRRRGIEVRILSLRPPSDALCHEVVTRSGLIDLTLYDRDQFRSLLRQFRPQLIHAHFATEPAAAARELAYALEVPFTFTAHGYDIYRRPPPDFADRAADAASVITVSQANARHLVQALGVESSQIQVIPCGIDVGLFRPGGPRPEPPHVVCVARLVPVKNLGLLLEAFAELRSRGVRFRGIMVGDGKSRAELEAMHARLGLQETVQMVGAADQAEVLAWWQRASVAVLTSEREGMPVCLMEAAACGVPAVAPAVGGIPELVEDGVTGLLAPAGDRAALVTALAWLLENRESASRMGDAARMRAVHRFSVSHQVERLVKLWSDLIRKKAPLCQSK